jgi:hypothetical protein
VQPRTDVQAGITPAFALARKATRIRGWERTDDARDAAWTPEAAMDVLTSIGHAIEFAVNYVETHHWTFGFLAFGYIFYLHDKAVHARFDSLDKRVDEMRRRLALDH